MIRVICVGSRQDASHRELVDTSANSFASVQARKLVHFAVPPLPTKPKCFARTPYGGKKITSCRRLRRRFRKQRVFQPVSPQRRRKRELQRACQPRRRKRESQRAFRQRRKRQEFQRAYQPRRKRLREPRFPFYPIRTDWKVPLCYPP